MCDQTGKKRNLNRRAFLKASAATVTLISSLETQFPFGANVAQAAGPETTKANLGFIALTDAAPLFVANTVSDSATAGDVTLGSNAAPPMYALARSGDAR